MNKWTNIEQYKKIYAFIGARAFRLLILGVFTGLLVFFAELAFSYVIQIFLVKMNIAPSSQATIPQWLPLDNSKLFFAFVAIAVFFRGFTQWLNVYVSSASYEVQRDNFRYRLSEWVLRAKSVSTGEMLTLYNQGIESVCQVLMSLQSMSVYFSTVLFTWIFLFRISVQLTLIATFFLALIGFITKVFDKRSASLAREVTDQLEQTNRMMVNNIKNLLLVKIYGTQEKERKSIKSKLSYVLDQVLGYQKLVYLRSIMPQVLGIILICFLSVLALEKNWIESALILTYFYLFTRGVQGFSEALRLSSTIKFHMPNTERMAKWWVHNAHDGFFAEKQVENNHKEFPRDSLIGWKLDDVSFGFSPNSKNVIKKYSLEIKAGETVVMTGDSGSGKSTLISILLGLYEPNQGTVDLVINDNLFPLKGIKQQLLNSVGYVGSESFLIEGTILDNLLYGLNHQPTEEEISQALEDAGCSFVFQFDMTIQHKLTEQGQGLSAGQKQRICFARALLRKPSVLVLDEATANLDSESERKFIQTLIRLKDKMTIVAVTHREALLGIADKVIQFPIH